MGCIVDKHNYLTHLMYDLPDKWGQIAVFTGKELEYLRQFCWEDKNACRFGFEVMNQIIDKGGKFLCISNDKIKMVDIDSSKDIQKAKEILL